MAIRTARRVMGLGPSWPPRDVAPVWEEIDTLAALRDSDDAALRGLAAALGMSGTHSSYLSVPLPRLISRAKANLLFGEPPDVDAEDDADQDNVDRLVDENDLAAELHRAAVVASSEGEVWGKVTVAPAVLGVPIIEFVSRRHVIPRFAGRFCVGATFVSEYEQGESRAMATAVYRQLETHEPGLVTTKLYLGTRTQLGSQVPLSQRPETQDLLMNDGQASVVLTGIDRPLCVFVPNALDTDPTRGVSDYLGVILGFLAINESETIGQANARLVGRKRLFVDGKYLNSRGNLPADNDVYRADSTISENGAKGGPIATAQYTFESAALVEWLNHLIDLTLTLAGVSPSSVGRDVNTGSARSGTALRLRMAHTLMEAAGTGRYFDRGVRQLVRMAQLLDSRQFARRYVAPDAMPAVERSDGLPADTLEQAQELQMLRAAEVVSTEQAVRMLHPDWSDNDIQSEVDRITQAAQPVTTSGIAQPAPTVTLPGAPQGGTTVEGGTSGRGSVEATTGGTR